MRPTFRLAGLLLCLPAAGRAQSDPIAESRIHYQQAVRAYESRDYPAFLDHARRAQSLRPAHGGVTYTLASAQSLTGDTAAALRSLRRLAAMGYAADVAADSDFAPLRGSAGLAEVERRLRENAEPVVHGTEAFVLPEPDLLAEGLAYDPQDGAFYVGSVHRRKIVRMTPDGRFSDFASLERAGPWAPLGMRVDARRRTLWVAAGAVPQMRGYSPVDSGQSALLRFDLETGALVGRYPAPAGEPHALGDVVVSRSGDVYATDSRSPVIYRLQEGGRELEPFVRSPLLHSAQGLALGPDERTLYVADYARGVLRIDLQRRTVEPLPTADTVAALGIDGLYYHDGALIGIQNGIAPHRVVRLVLGEGDRIERSDVLERAHPRHDEPTLGVIVGRELYYVANAQWERFGDGRVTDPEPLRPPVVLRLRL